jgi:leucyl aminopeptidase
MSLPPCFSTNENAARATPLVMLDRESLPAWLAQQSVAIGRWTQAQDFNASPGSALLVPDADGAPRCALAGIGDVEDPYACAHLPFALPPGDYRLDPRSPHAIDPGTLLLGWGLGAYRFERYRAAQRPPARLVLEDTAAELSESFALLKASTLVRDLVNTPTEDLGPDQLEAVAHRLAQAYGATIHVIVGDALLTANFPAIHAVGRASHRAPRLIELHWGNPAHPHVAIVGKGVCFDTGGLDIKTVDGMRNMKKDMGGGAHALGLAQLVMACKLPVRMTLLVPAVENAISASSYRPGDVVRTRSGITVEIDNTDAEGRMVLCDAMSYAIEQSPALLLDFSTLTGAARVALGPDLPALFCNDERLASEYLDVSTRVRDPVWRLPLWRPYENFLKSNVADLVNAGNSRMGGAITAAVFLQRFVPDTLPWAHIDGYAWNDTDRPGRAAGGEAQGLRAAFALLKHRFAR